MKIKDLITQIKTIAQKEQKKFGCDEYLKDLLQYDQNTIVQVSNGDCEYDGVYAPFKKDGGLDIHEARPFEEGQPFPDDGHDWVRIGYLPPQEKMNSPSR